MVIFSPWAFGTTQPAVILVMNLVGYALGLLLTLKWFIRSFKGYRPRRWSDQAAPGLAGLTRTLGALTVAILTYGLISALNARASYQPEDGSFDYHSAIAWLPQSYDRPGTWRALRNFLALACFFWAVRDWLQGASTAEERSLRKQTPGTTAGAPAYLSARLRVLLWVLCLNGGLLAAESIAQRLSGTSKLLWLVEPRINKTPISQLGPYAYRSNGAQYFNLAWPVCLGFWWIVRRELRHHPPPVPRRKVWGSHALLAAALFMVAAPILSASRAGAVVAFAAAFVATAILLYGRRRRHRNVKLGALLFFGVTVATAIYFGRGQLGERFKHFDRDYESRDAIYETARKIPGDFPVFGTGPGTFEAVFQLYRSSTDEYWPTQLHNDWLETLITFGWTGSLLIALTFGCVLLRWFVPGGIQANWRMTALLWLALAGCMFHARYDFPFQIYSILLLFLLECAILSVVTLCVPSRPSLGP